MPQDVSVMEMAAAAADYGTDLSIGDVVWELSFGDDDES